MDHKIIFKERLRTLRKEVGETQAQAAAAVNIGESHYQKFELGSNLPNFINLIALADHFEVSLDYLTGRADQR